MGTPPHPTASAVLGVGKARAGQRSPRHSSDGPHHWLCLQPNPHCECVAPTKAAAALPAVIKAFHCIIDRCVSPWEAADAGCSTTAFHNLGLMINSTCTTDTGDHRAPLFAYGNVCSGCKAEPPVLGQPLLLSLTPSGRGRILGL